MTPYFAEMLARDHRAQLLRDADARRLGGAARHVGRLHRWIHRQSSARPQAFRRPTVRVTRVDDHLVGGLMALDAADLAAKRTAAD